MNKTNKIRNSMIMLVVFVLLVVAVYGAQQTPGQALGNAFGKFTGLISDNIGNQGGPNWLDFALFTIIFISICFLGLSKVFKENMRAARVLAITLGVGMAFALVKGGVSVMLFFPFVKNMIWVILLLVLYFILTNMPGFKEKKLLSLLVAIGLIFVLFNVSNFVFEEKFDFEGELSGIYTSDEQVQTAYQQVAAESYLTPTELKKSLKGVVAKDIDDSWKRAQKNILKSVMKDINPKVVKYDDMIIKNTDSAEDAILVTLLINEVNPDFNPKKVEDGRMGLMQIDPKIVGTGKLSDPETNIKKGSDYLFRMIKKYERVEYGLIAFFDGKEYAKKVKEGVERDKDTWEDNYYKTHVSEIASIEGKYSDQVQKYNNIRAEVVKKLVSKGVTADKAKDWRKSVYRDQVYEEEKLDFRLYSLKELIKKEIDVTESSAVSLDKIKTFEELLNELAKDAKTKKEKDHVESTKKELEDLKKQVNLKDASKKGGEISKEMYEDYAKIMTNYNSINLLIYNDFKDNTDNLQKLEELSDYSFKVYLELYDMEGEVSRYEDDESGYKKLIVSLLDEKLRDINEIREKISKELGVSEVVDDAEIGLGDLDDDDDDDDDDDESKVMRVRGIIQDVKNHYDSCDDAIRDINDYDEFVRLFNRHFETAGNIITDNSDLISEVNGKNREIRREFEKLLSRKDSLTSQGLKKKKLLKNKKELSELLAKISTTEEDSLEELRGDIAQKIASLGAIYLNQGEEQEIIGIPNAKEKLKQLDQKIAGLSTETVDGQFEKLYRIEGVTLYSPIKTSNLYKKTIKSYKEFYDYLKKGLDEDNLPTKYQGYELSDGPRFGVERTKVDGTKYLHSGIDIYTVPLSCTNPVYAAAPGKVVYVRDHPIAGYHVVIEHVKDKVYTRYLHLKKEGLVSEGKEITTNEIPFQIGKVGGTGNANGKCHLHFEIGKELRGTKLYTVYNPLDKDTILDVDANKITTDTVDDTEVGDPLNLDDLQTEDADTGETEDLVPFSENTFKKAREAVHSEHFKIEFFPQGWESLDEKNGDGLWDITDGENKQLHIKEELTNGNLMIYSKKESDASLYCTRVKPGTCTERSTNGNDPRSFKIMYNGDEYRFNIDRIAKMPKQDDTTTTDEADEAAGETVDTVADTTTPDTTAPAETTTVEYTVVEKEALHRDHFKPLIGDGITDVNVFKEKIKDITHDGEILTVLKFTHIDDDEYFLRFSDEQRRCMRDQGKDSETGCSQFSGEFRTFTFMFNGEKYQLRDTVLSKVVKVEAADEAPTVKTEAEKIQELKDYFNTVSPTLTFISQHGAEPLEKEIDSKMFAVYDNIAIFKVTFDGIPWDPLFEFVNKNQEKVKGIQSREGDTFSIAILTKEGTSFVQEKVKNTLELFLVFSKGDYKKAHKIADLTVMIPEEKKASIPVITTTEHTVVEKVALHRVYFEPVIGEGITDINVFKEKVQDLKLGEKSLQIVRFAEYGEDEDKGHFLHLKPSEKEGGERYCMKERAEGDKVGCSLHTGADRKFTFKHGDQVWQIYKNKVSLISGGQVVEEDSVESLLELMPDLPDLPSSEPVGDVRKKIILELDVKKKDALHKELFSQKHFAKAYEDWTIFNEETGTQYGIWDVTDGISKRLYVEKIRENGNLNVYSEKDEPDPGLYCTRKPLEPKPPGDDCDARSRSNNPGRTFKIIYDFEEWELTLGKIKKKGLEIETTEVGAENIQIPELRKLHDETVMKLGGYIILPEYSDPIVRQLTGVTIELDEKLIGALVSKKIGPTLTIPEVSKKPKEVVKEGFDEIIRKVNQLAEDKVMTKQDVLEMLGVTEKKMNKLIVLKLREVEQKQDVEKDVFDIKDFELEEEFYALSTYHFAGLKEDGLTLEDIKKDVLNLNYGDGIIKITDYYTGMEILKGYTDKNANNKRDDDEEAEDYEKLETYCMKDESGEEKKAGCPNRLGANRVFTFTYNDKNYELTIEKLVEKATQAVSTVERTFKRPEINTVLLFIEKIVPGVHKDLKKKINDQLVWDSTFMAYYNFYEENPDTVKLIVGDKAIVPSEQIKKDIKKEMGNILSWPEIFREEFKVYIGDDKANNEEAGELLYLIKGKLGELPKGLEKYQDILDVYYQRKVLVVVDSKRVSFDSVIELNLLEDNEIKVHKHDVGATVEINNFAIEDVEPVQLFASLEDPYGDNELEVNDKRATDVRFKKPENPKEWFGIAQKLFENKDMELLKEKVEEPITEPEEQQEEMPVEEELPEPEETIIEAPSELLDLDEPTGEVIE